MKKISALFLLIALSGLLQNCKKSQFRHQDVNLVEFFPYLTRGFEASTLKFTRKDRQESKYQLEGFSTYRDQLPRTWAVEKVSSITAYLSELEDKTATLRCRPFNPPGQPPQEGEIFFNGTFLKKIITAKTGQYRFDIPAGLMSYGSNRLTFKWKYSRSHAEFGINNDKRPYAVGFSYLTFQSQSKQRKKTRSPGQVQLDLQGKFPGFTSPGGQ